AFEQALAIDPRDREALEALEPLAQEQKDDARLLLSLRGQLAVADDVRRPSIALKLGAVHERLQDGAAATFAYVLAREKGKPPERQAALVALERVYRATERWNDLAVVLAERAKSERELAPQLLLERARVLETHLARHDLAIESLQEARKLG